MEETGAQSRKRRRPALACEQCRRRKIRCDRNVPCENCARSASEACTYVLDDTETVQMKPNRPRTSTNDNVTPRPKNPSINLDSSRAISSLNPSPSKFYGVQDATSSSFNRSSAWTKSDLESSSDLELTHPISNSQVLVDRVRFLEQKLADVVSFQYAGSFMSYSSEGPDPEISASVRGTFSKTRYFGQSHWMNSAEQFRKILGLLSSFENDEDSEIKALLEKCKSIARSAKTREVVNLPVKADFRDYIPDRRIADQLVQAYLRTFESVYRILHVPSFLTEYYKYWTEPESASDAFVIQLLLLMAIGTCFYQDHKESNSTLKISSSQWIYTAQAWLDSPFQKSRITLQGLQVHCLLLLARQTNAVGSDLIWISAGALLTTAMHMGLHIDPHHSPQMLLREAECRRRLWATVLEIVLQSSMDSGGLPLIAFPDYDCEPPSNFNDIQLDELTTASTEPKPDEQFTQTSVQIALARSMQIRLEIGRFINDFRIDLSYQEVLRLGAELSSICRTNSVLFQSFASDPAPPSTFQSKLLVLLTHRSLLALHHPFAVKAKSDATFYYSRKVCLETSLYILSPAITTNPSSEDYNQLRLRGTALFRDVPLKATSVVCEELIIQLEEEKRSFTSPPSSTSRKELRKVVEDYVVLTRLRIEAGEMNIRGHVFFSCLLAQVDAMQADESVEQAVVIALKASLEVAYRLLKTMTEGNCPAPIETRHGFEKQLDNMLVGDQSEWFRIEDLIPQSALSDMDSWLLTNPTSTDNDR
ncbi:hypothetical protein VTL71DRAFT_12401 [Oculimacula yallundae]|uniref:Zn(2)-C6 fungal-type domain-containing protein n=1 Tax=Oculimacula yallundae TaxID=86028 RepID=A0ABR4CP38_9HELO